MLISISDNVKTIKIKKLWNLLVTLSLLSTVLVGDADVTTIKSEEYHDVWEGDNLEAYMSQNWRK